MRRTVQQSRYGPILCGVALTVLAFLHFDRVFPLPDLGGDPIRDQLMARDCTELGHCYLTGVDTSFPGLYQGAVWLDQIVMVRLLGGDLEAQRRVILGLLAVSVATVFVVVWRWIGVSIACPTAIIFVGLLDANSTPAYLTNPSSAIFFDVLATAALLCHALSGRRRFLFVSAVSIGIGVCVHNATATLLAPFLVIAALSRRRPWAAIAGSLAALAGTYAMSSSTALENNLHTLEGYPRTWIALVLLAVLVALTVSVSDSFRRLGPAGRAWVSGAIMIVPFGVAILWVRVVEQHQFHPYYYLPVIAPVATIAGALLWGACRIAARQLRFRLAAPGVSSSLIALLVFPPWHPPSWGQTSEWTLPAAAVVADEIGKRGWSYEDLAYRLQADRCYDLLVRMSAFAPPPRLQPRPDGHQIQVVKTTPDAIANVDGIAVATIPGDTQVLAIREIDSWLRPESMRVCRKPAAAGQSTTCGTPRAPSRELNSPERFRFARRALPGIHFAEPPRPYTASYEIPLSSVAGGAREFILSPPEGVAGCEWKFTHVEGLVVDEPLPSSVLHARSTAGGAGRLVVEGELDTVRCNNTDGAYPPCVLEIEPGDPLRALIEGR